MDNDFLEKIIARGRSESVEKIGILPFELKQLLKPPIATGQIQLNHAMISVSFNAERMINTKFNCFDITPIYFFCGEWRSPIKGGNTYIFGNDNTYLYYLRVNNENWKLRHFKVSKEYQHFGNPALLIHISNAEDKLFINRYSKFGQFIFEINNKEIAVV